MYNVFLYFNLFIVFLIYAKIILTDRRPEFSCLVFFDFCTFYFTIGYYSLGGKTYGVFDIDLLLGASVISLISASNIYLLSKIKFPIIKINKKFFGNHWYKFVIFFVFTILILWLIYNSNNLILFQILGHKELTRLDILQTGVKGYYTYYSIVMFVLTYFFFKNFHSKGYKSLDLIYLILITVFAVAAGNKAVIVYFIALVLIFWIKTNRLQFKMLLTIKFIFLGCISFYYLLKGYTGVSITTVVISAFRRLFLTQGAGMLNRWDELSGSEFVFGANIGSYLVVTEEIYLKVYGHFGSMPSHAWGDFILDYGFILGTVFCLMIYWVYAYLFYQLRLNGRDDLIIILLMSFFVIQQGGINSNQIQRILFSIFVLMFMSMFKSGVSKIEN